MSNSLAAVHPELIAEWSDRNLPLTPDSVTFGSNKKVWWKGACGHEWETSIKARSSGEKCPICSGARVVAGINDLSTLKPKLASEWSEKNEIKPTQVSIGSHKKVTKFDVPIWHKTNLTVEEAAAYSGVGVKKLREMTDSEYCQFVLWNETKRLIKREKLDKYLAEMYSILCYRASTTWQAVSLKSLRSGQSAIFR